MPGRKLGTVGRHRCANPAEGGGALPRYAVARRFHGTHKHSPVDRVLGEDAHAVGQAGAGPDAAEPVERGLYGRKAVLAVHALNR